MLYLTVLRAVGEAVLIFLSLAHEDDEDVDLYEQERNEALTNR